YRLIKSKKETRIIPAEDFAYFEVEPEEDKSFTFIVLTHNNRDLIDRNIDSILSQKYSDFRVVYIDQGSTDGTVDRICQKKCDKVSLIECQEGHEVYQRYYDLVVHSKNDEIIVHLYGNDWLAHEEVLSRLNQSYMNPDVWLTYGQYIDSANFEKGIHDPQPKKILYKKRVQRAPWVVAPFKTYYAGLFKKLHVETGFFISIKDENALLVPMAELAKAHVRFIPHVLYIHSQKHQESQKQGRVAMMPDQVKSAMEKVYTEALVDLILLSEDSPQDLAACLASCQEYLQGISAIHVIYQSSDSNFHAYEQVKSRYPGVRFTHGGAGLKTEILHSLWRHAASSPYVILSTDQVGVSTSISLPVCIAAMQKTQAYGFYFHLGREGAKQGEGVYSWNICRAEGAFKNPDVLQMGLYRRLELEQEIKTLSFSTIQDLIQAWTNGTDRYRVGLSFEESKVSSSSVEMLTQS
ncbi:MAG: glycosyltransferase family 2 protein, partial [Chlamydiia bacterium]|nr:glycosyltransferase family 2 protein [Chlamydiia bacterium]